VRFSDRVVAVTGASRGIGREIALRFGAEGAQVACIATSARNAEPTSQAIEPTSQAIVEAGGRAQAYGCDVSNGEAVERLFAQIGEDLGGVAILVNNAGLTRDTLLLRMDEEAWDRVLDVNLKGAFLTTKAAIKAMMKARWGRLINITSIIGLTGQAGQANYAASKAGLIGFTKSMAKELGSRGVTCNSIAPGFIETDMTDALPETMREEVVKGTPLGRLGTPADIAGTVLFLASDDAAFITGQTFVVDGGLTL